MDDNQRIAISTALAREFAHYTKANDYVIDFEDIKHTAFVVTKRYENPKLAYARARWVCWEMVTCKHNYRGIKGNFRKRRDFTELEYHLQRIGWNKESETAPDVQVINRLSVIETLQPLTLLQKKILYRSIVFGELYRKIGKRYFPDIKHHDVKIYNELSKIRKKLRFHNRGEQKPQYQRN